MKIGNKIWFSTKRFVEIIENSCEFFLLDKDNIFGKRNHRKNGPSSTFCDFINLFTWRDKCKYHRIDGRAYISDSGGISSWYFNDKILREESYWNA